MQNNGIKGRNEELTPTRGIDRFEEMNEIFVDVEIIKVQGKNPAGILTKLLRVFYFHRRSAYQTIAHIVEKIVGAVHVCSRILSRVIMLRLPSSEGFISISLFFCM